MKTEEYSINSKTGEMTENPFMRRITKIKTSEKKIHIEYQVWKNEHWDDYSMTCNQEARPEFHDSLGDLTSHVLEILDLPEMWIAGVTISGMSLSYPESVMGAVITGKKTLVNSNSPFVFNTPFKMSEPLQEGGDDTTCMHPALVDAIEEVCYEAWKYIEGDRVQLDLFAGQQDAATVVASNELTRLHRDIERRGVSVTVHTKEVARA